MVGLGLPQDSGGIMAIWLRSKGEERGWYVAYRIAHINKHTK